MSSIRLHRLAAFVLLVTLSRNVAFAEAPPRPDPETAGLKPAALRRLDALLQDAVERRQIAGGVVLLARHGKLGHLKAIGWRDVEAKQPMTPDTLFRIASMTKPVTSAAVMMLVDDGKIRLNDPLSKYVPAFKETKVLVPSKRDGEADALKPLEREITIHDLLTHTSGITYRLLGQKPWCDLYRKGGVSDGLMHPPGTIGDNINRLAKQPLMFQPGRSWMYGLSTDVLGRVVEVASEKDLATFLRERLFRPLKMEDTFFFVPEAKKARLATVYTLDEDKKIIPVGDEPVTKGAVVYSTTYPCTKDGKYFSGGAGLVSTARDYARFLQMLLNGGELDGVRLLKAETVKQMTTNQLGEIKFGPSDLGDAFGYGFGIVTQAGNNRDVASAGSYSWGGFFFTYFWVDPRKELIGVLMSQMYPGHPTLQKDFKKRAYEALAD